MFHSLIISGKNTFVEWGIVPTTRPVVAPPKVKTTYADLPAAHGMLDYTGLLLGEVPYGQREDSWTFVVRAGARWSEVYSSLMNYLHGKRHTVILEDDPDFLYTGRLTVNRWKSDPANSKIVIDYNLDPFKYNVESTDDTEWLWDDLFADVIRYGRFTVSGSKWRNFINRGERAAIPTFTCSAPLTVSVDGEEFSLVKGKNYTGNLMIKPGDTEMLFTGNAEVVVAYREVSL